MEVEAVPLTDFVHGRYNAREGHPMAFPASVATSLERAGLVRITTTAQAPVKVGPGKPADDGAGQPSSASPAAPPLQTKTLHSSKHGEAKPRKSGA